MNESTLIAKVWNFATVLRDAGLTYTDYVSQLTYLLFLKMDDERVDVLGEQSALPDGCGWRDLLPLTGSELEAKYRQALETLSVQSGIIGTIYAKAQNKISSPAHLARLISLINEEVWLGMDVDVKGAIYEGLLQKNATESKAGAGQYFTPRPLIKAIVEVMKPTPDMTVVEPTMITEQGGLHGYGIYAN